MTSPLAKGNEKFSVADIIRVFGGEDKKTSDAFVTPRDKKRVGQRRRSKSPQPNRRSFIGGETTSVQKLRELFEKPSNEVTVSSNNGDSSKEKTSVSNAQRNLALFKSSDVRAAVKSVKRTPSKLNGGKIVTRGSVAEAWLRSNSSAEPPPPPDVSPFASPYKKINNPSSETSSKTPSTSKNSSSETSNKTSSSKEEEFPKTTPPPKNIADRLRQLAGFGSGHKIKATVTDVTSLAASTYTATSITEKTLTSLTDLDNMEDVTMINDSNHETNKNDDQDKDDENEDNENDEKDDKDDEVEENGENDGEEDENEEEDDEKDNEEDEDENTSSLSGPTTSTLAMFTTAEILSLKLLFAIMDQDGDEYIEKEELSAYGDNTHTFFLSFFFYLCYFI